jgi:hypothetical protein
LRNANPGVLATREFFGSRGIRTRRGGMPAPHSRLTCWVGLASALCACAVFPSDSAPVL